MREDEAREKWCPMVRLNQSACNRDSQSNIETPYYKCVGSDCALWVTEGGGLSSGSFGRCGLINK